MIGQIEKIEKHPDADKLIICQVNIGTETVQIVTGAPNVKEGDKVVVFTSSWGSKSLSIGEVVKKTPTGLIDVKISGGGVTRYKKNGYPYAKTERYSTCRNYLMPYSEELERQIQQDKDRRDMIAYLSKVSWSKYTNEELDNILRYISRLRSS